MLTHERDRLLKSGVRTVKLYTIHEYHVAALEDCMAPAGLRYRPATSPSLQLSLRIVRIHCI